VVSVFFFLWQVFYLQGRLEVNGRSVCRKRTRRTFLVRKTKEKEKKRRGGGVRGWVPYCHALWLDSPDKAHRKRESCKRVLFLPLSYLIASHFLLAALSLPLSGFDNTDSESKLSLLQFYALQIPPIQLAGGRLALQNPPTSTVPFTSESISCLSFSLSVSLAFSVAFHLKTRIWVVW
jgi:hypothetical protein